MLPARVSVLLAYVEGDIEPPDLGHMLDLVDRLRSSGTWTVAPPELVNEGDGDYRTLGVLLRLPISSDRQADERSALDDVERFVNAIEIATESWPAEVAFELDGSVVGWVAAGARDRLLRDGLIGPWRDRLAESTE